MKKNRKYSSREENKISQNWTKFEEEEEAEAQRREKLKL